MKFILSFFIFLPILATSQSVEKGKTLYQEFAVVNKSQKDYAESRYYLGRIAFDKNELDKAQTYFEEAIDVNATVADYHYWLGNTLGAIAQGANTFKQGILAPKIKSAFERTVELDPTNIPAHRGLIEFYTQAPGFMGGRWQQYTSGRIN
jgi:tetratricopeptide (TPR) repeat protein